MLDLLVRGLVQYSLMKWNVKEARQDLLTVAIEGLASAAVVTIVKTQG